MEKELIIVSGANGQLGTELQLLSKNEAHYKWIFTDVDELNICKKEELQQYFEMHKPSIFINAAAYTAVDKAETETDEAYALNTTAITEIAKLCKYHHCFFIHISTDFVFDGKKNTPYFEDDPLSGNGVYGLSKQKGEEELLNHAENAVIIRTSWLYGNYGHNFMKTILNKGCNGNELKVVYDQLGSPTWSKDLAEAVFAICEEKDNFSGIEIFHFSNEGIASWYDFAWEILSIAGEKPNIIPVEAIEFTRPAPRPSYSVMSKKKISSFLNIRIPHWKESLAKCILEQKKK